ncbi:MAG: hypothetical protein PHX61_04860 [Alphaproteobacteria bacterium]|nr:hypothetical protein [Alphaproteobacteria bacterium]
MDIDISYLEINPAFRSDELYFIRLAGGYVRSIFWDVFLSNNKNRPRELYKLISDEFSGDSYSHLRAQIVPDPNNHGKRNGQLDCIGGAFKTLLEKMPADMVVAFEEVLRINYGIFLRFKDDKGNAETLTFVKAVECLSKRRNYLEHYEQNNGKKRNSYNKRRDSKEFVFKDETFLEALGLFVLPELLHKFAGRVASYEVKQGGCTENSKMIREKGALIIKERKQNTRQLFSVERSRQAHKNKTKRKYLADPNIPWRIAYKSLNHSRTDYREHEFKVRYYFIGKPNIEKIRGYVFSDKNKGEIHFKRDIEALYILTCDINLILHRALEELKERDRVVAVDEDNMVLLKNLRNHVAHGGFFWDVKNDQMELFSVGEIFEGILSACLLKLGKEKANNIFVQLERELRKEKFSIADVNGTPPMHLHIKKWGVKNRLKYLETDDEDVSVYMRRSYRKMVGKWITALLKAKHAMVLEKKREKCQIHSA